MKVNKIISTGIGEITNPSSNEARYILKNHISAYKLKRSEITDIYEKLADERTQSLRLLKICTILL